MLKYMYTVGRYGLEKLPITDLIPLPPSLSQSISPSLLLLLPQTGAQASTCDRSIGGTR